MLCKIRQFHSNDFFKGQHGGVASSVSVLRLWLDPEVGLLTGFSHDSPVPSHQHASRYSKAVST